MERRVLITGATGMIGKKLTEFCHQKGFAVHYFTRDKSKIKYEDNYKGFLWDIEAGTLDKEAFRGVDSIIHLAGASIAKRWTSAYKKEIIDSRIRPMELMYSVLKNMDHSIDHFISASGINIYPSSPTKLYTEEDTERNDNFITTVVEKWEEGATAFRKLGMEISKVRTGLVLAKNGGVLPTLVKPVKLGIGSPLGTGEQWQSWIHVNDIAGIYMFIMENTMEGIYNAVAPNPVKNKRMIKLIAEKLKKPLWAPAVPSFALKILLGEIGTLALESQLVSSQKIRELGYSFQYSGIEPALDDLLT